MSVQFAKTLGAIAFAKGLPCAPATDSDFMSHINSEVGSNVAAMAAWQRGWVEAYLADWHDASHELVRTGKMALRWLAKAPEESDLDIRIIPNGPGVREAVEDMILKFPLRLAA